MNLENITSSFTANYSLFNQAIRDGDLNKVVQIANVVLKEVSKHSTLNSTKKTKVFSLKMKLFLISMQISENEILKQKISAKTNINFGKESVLKNLYKIYMYGSHRDKYVYACNRIGCSKHFL